MLLSELRTEINNLFDLAGNSNFNADDLITHAFRWYSSFVRKTTTAVFTFTSGVKSYTFPTLYDGTTPKLIIDDDDATIHRPYSIYQPSDTGEFYILPSGESYTLVFRETPTRSRSATFVYERPIIVPTTGTDVIDVPDKHMYVIHYFIEALSETQRQVEFVWGGLPVNYEAYFLGQTGDQVRRSWERCQSARKEIEEEQAYGGIDVGYVLNWNQMDVVDAYIRPINYQFIY